MTEKQPQVRSTVEALRLANYFDYHGFFDSDMKAAAELRRLHQSEAEGWRYAEELEQERKRLHEVNQELLEALQRIKHHFDTDEYAWKIAEAAITKAGEQP